MRDGILYVARGAGYVDLARASAESLRRVAPDLPIDLFTDQPDTGGPFDRVRPIPDHDSRDKIVCMALSRFDRTLFLDCDTLALAPPGDLFDVLDRFDLAVCHDVRRTTDLVRQGWQVRTPYAFPQMNTGVLLYRRCDAVMRFLADWARDYTRAGLPRDQPTFRDLLWSSDLRFYVLPEEFNLRRVTVLDAWEPQDAIPTFLHSHRLLQHLRGAGPRLTELTEVLPLERTARAAEWAGLGLAPLTADGEDPATRFAQALAVLRLRPGAE